MNHSNTSASIRNEIGCLTGGWTTVAWSQKSPGRSANSAGDVSRISRSLVRRRRPRSARPRGTWLLRPDGSLVRFTLTAATHSGRNDPSDDSVADPSPVGIHHGEPNSRSLAQGDNPTLTVVAATVLSLQCGPLEDQRGKLEVEASLTKVPDALTSVPTETHADSIRLYIQPRQPALSG